MIGGATSVACVLCSGASVVNGRAVVFRTGVKPVRGLFRLLGVVTVLRWVASTPSDVNPWTGTGSSPSSGAARFFPATMATGVGSWNMEVDAFAGSGVFARKTDGAGRLSGVLRPRSAEGPDIARERDGEVDETGAVDDDRLVCCTGAVTRGCWVTGLFCLELDAGGCAGF